MHDIGWLDPHKLDLAGTFKLRHPRMRRARGSAREMLVKSRPDNQVSRRFGTDSPTAANLVLFPITSSFSIESGWPHVVSPVPRDETLSAFVCAQAVGIEVIPLQSIRSYTIRAR